MRRFSFYLRRFPEEHAFDAQTNDQESHLGKMFCILKLGKTEEIIILSLANEGKRSRL